MGPKKAAEPEKVEPKDGANVCYCRIKLVKEEEYVEVTLNTNSRVDIVLDHAKAQLLQKVSKLLSTPAPQPPAPAPLPEPVEGEEEAAAPAEEEDKPDPVAEWNALIERLQAIQSALQPVAVESLEFHDGEHGAELSQKLAENGREILAPTKRYNVGIMDGEEFKEF